MTTKLLNPNDSGDIPRYDDLGEGQTEDLRHHLRRDTTGELTENIGKYLVNAPSFEAIPRRIIEIDDTVTFSTSRVIGLGDLDGPQTPPPPLPKPKDPAETGVNIFGGMGEHLPEAAFPGYIGRHRHPEDQDVVADERRWLSPWGAVALIAVVGLAIWVGLTLAAAAVIW